jgi:hypothetical protein
MKHTFYLALLATTFFGCNQESKSEEPSTIEAEIVSADSDTGFIHVVYFWLKEDLTDEQLQRFEAEGLVKLATCPTIQKVYYGPPAMSPRDIVDNSYSYAWICHFKNKADQDAYQEEPIHLKFIEDFSSMWTKVQIFDNLVSS